VCGGEANAGGAGDAVAEDGAAGPGSLGDGFASTVGACYETVVWRKEWWQKLAMKD
jgi:hypothetical protein